MLSIKGEVFERIGHWFLDHGWKLITSFGFAYLWKAANGHIVLQTTDSAGFVVVVRGDSGDPARVLLVKQHRPATVNPEDNPYGLIIEATAGHFDDKLTPVELIVKEADEEVGVRVRPDQVYFINDGKPLYLSPGIITEKQVLAVVVVDHDQIEDKERVFGNAEEGERITRVHMTLKEFVDGVHEDMKTFALATWLEANMEKLGLK